MSKAEDKMNKIADFFHQRIYVHIHIPLYYRWFSRQLDVRNGEETIGYIVKNRASISRFGDYEYMSLNDESNNFNRSNQLLANRLKEVLEKEVPNLAVCLPHAFCNLHNDNKHARTFWKYYIAQKGKFILANTPRNRIYYDASFTRFYMDARDKSPEKIQSYIDKLRMIWDKRNLLIVEGNDSRFGVGDDLLSNSLSIRRILCPSTDAFLKYDEILTTIKEEAKKGDLIMMALGATATVLAYDLTKEGYQALDIGHADVEYCWFKMGATHKVPIPGKAVNEVGINDAGENNDQAYLSQIIRRI